MSVSLTKTKRGQKAWLSGRVAEIVAAGFLMLKGYKILARNWRSPAGEVDILAAKNDALKNKTLIIVEVKYRPHMKGAEEAISHRQQQRLQRAALCAQAAWPHYTGVRADVIFLAPWHWPRHIRNAWSHDV